VDGPGAIISCARPSLRALALTGAIGEAFAREADRRGTRTLVVTLPGASSFRTRAALDIPEYAPLIDALAARGVEVFDPAPALLAGSSNAAIATFILTRSSAEDISAAPAAPSLRRWSHPIYAGAA
jgi:hypothetical protein